LLGEKGHCRNPRHTVVLDREHIRRERIRVLPPVYPLTALAAAFLLDGAMPLGAVPAPVRWTGAGLAAAGLAVMVWALAAQWRAGTDPNPWAGTRRLVTTGPYRFSRNPIYACDLLLQAGIGLAAGWWWALVLLPATWAALRYFAIAKEERFLRSLFGPQYEGYCRRVRRWI
jgi:protein-S-isoprenylcysteine O-methyltransferase Ste14